MRLSEKYGKLMREDPDKAIKVFIKDGWMSCSIPRYEEVMYVYNTTLKETGVSSRAVEAAADATGYSESMVYHIVQRMK